jgi:hypothetical protein
MNSDRHSNVGIRDFLERSLTSVLNASKRPSVEKLEFAAQQHEPAKDGLECASVIIAKIGDGFEVRRQPAQ